MSNRFDDRPNTSRRQYLSVIIVFVASGLGTGISPVAPGTVGSLLALGIYALIPINFRMFFNGLLPVTFFLGVVVAKRAEQRWERDDRRITIDEMVGMWCALVGLPLTVSVYASAFFLFRIFDIIKPLGINRSQKLPHGWGVMIDDLLAGVYTNISLRIILWILAVH